MSRLLKIKRLIVPFPPDIESIRYSNVAKGQQSTPTMRHMTTLWQPETLTAVRFDSHLFAYLDVGHALKYIDNGKYSELTMSTSTGCRS
ncbi:MAG: hypothetical protein WCF57_05495 [Pyrinomonadaceae bacterium]